MTEFRSSSGNSWQAHATVRETLLSPSPAEQEAAEAFETSQRK